MSASAAPAWANPSPGGTAPSPLSVDQHESELFRPYSTLDEPVRETIMRDVNAVASKLRVVLQPLKSHAPYFSSLYRYGQLATSDGSASTGAAAADEGAGASPPPPSSSLPTPSPPPAGVPPSDQMSSQQQQLSEVDRQVIASLKDWDLWGPLVLCLTLAVTLSLKAPTHQSSLVFAAVFSLVWVGSTVVTLNAQLLGGSISFFQSLCVLGYSMFPLTLSALLIGVLRIVVHTWLWLDALIVAAGWMWAMRTSGLFVGLYIKPERRALALYPVALFYVVLAWMIMLF